VSGWNNAVHVPRRIARAARPFDTRRLADRLAEKLSRTAFTGEEGAFIASPVPPAGQRFLDRSQSTRNRGGTQGFPA